MELTVAELFAGVGGFRVGLNHISDIDSEGRAIENGEWNFVWANQYEPSTKAQHAFDCYVKRFGVENNSNIDINKVEKNEIPDHSLLVGGFPCQDYSVARSLNNEKGIEGKKGVLFWDIKDVLLAKNSPFVLLENVDRLLNSPSSKRGRDFAVMLKTFNDLSYDVQWRVINAGEYSMPQRRRRVFIFACKNHLEYSKSLREKDLNLEKDNIFNSEFRVKINKNIKEIDLNKYKDIIDVSDNFKEGKFLQTGIMINGKIICADVEAISEKKYPLSDVLEKAKEKNKNTEKYAITGEKLKKFEYLKGAKRIERTSKSGHKYFYSEGKMSFPEKLDEPSRTMLTSEGTVNRSSHVIFDSDINQYRIITPVESELLQMFPMNWTDTMPERRRYFMMGNALVTGIISRLEKKLRSIIKNEK